MFSYRHSSWCWNHGNIACWACKWSGGERELAEVSTLILDCIREERNQERPVAAFQCWWCTRAPYHIWDSTERSRKASESDSGLYSEDGRRPDTLKKPKLKRKKRREPHSKSNKVVHQLHATHHQINKHCAFPRPAVYVLLLGPWRL